LNDLSSTSLENQVKTKEFFTSINNKMLAKIFIFFKNGMFGGNTIGSFYSKSR
jgi:hypothetical protein